MSFLFFVKNPIIYQGFKIFLILIVMNNILFAGDFINEQKRYRRVRNIIKEKYNLIESNLKNNNIKI